MQATTITSTPPKTWDQIKSPLYWHQGAVYLLDQRRLPDEELWHIAVDDAQVAWAIREMVVRGAPAIGCAAAMGLAVGARLLPDDVEGFREGLMAACQRMAAARPTAVNLFWAIDRQRQIVDRFIGTNAAEVKPLLEEEAKHIWREDQAMCRAIGQHGAALLPQTARILTHCNAGALATAGYGTALGVIRAAREAGKSVAVFADETRPYFQGARLTAWELMREGIDVTVICDNMAGALFKQGAISCCVVGADRIARNGDVANKIGTYTVAVLARHHNVPFYVAAPRSTIDRGVSSGREIPIEERPADEVTCVAGTRIYPQGVKVRYPAFDVTPHELITAIITEVGVAQPPGEASIAALFS